MSEVNKSSKDTIDKMEILLKNVVGDLENLSKKLSELKRKNME